MHRYLLAFYKKGYMRFISHLDLQRLFRRSMKRAGIEPAYTGGFNPHERLYIAQPLSLGFESEKDYFEIYSERLYEPSALSEMFNSALPEGIKITFCREISLEGRKISARMDWSEYRAIFLTDKRPDIEGFLAQERICVLRRDKRSKKAVEREIKALIRSLECVLYSDGVAMLNMVLRSAANETLNPASLLESLCEFSGIEISREDMRITRLDSFLDVKGELVPLSEAR